MSCSTRGKDHLELDLGPHAKLTFIFSIDTRDVAIPQSQPTFAKFNSPQDIFMVSDGSLAATVLGAAETFECTSQDNGMVPWFS